MVDLEFGCPHCNTKFGVPRSYTGRKIKCPKCKKPVQIPNRQSDEAGEGSLPVAVELEKKQEPSKNNPGHTPKLNPGDDLIPPPVSTPTVSPLPPSPPISSPPVVTEAGVTEAIVTPPPVPTPPPANPPGTDQKASKGTHNPMTDGEGASEELEMYPPGYVPVSKVNNPKPNVDLKQEKLESKRRPRRSELSKTEKTDSPDVADRKNETEPTEVTSKTVVDLKTKQIKKSEIENNQKAASGIPKPKPPAANASTKPKVTTPIKSSDKRWSVLPARPNGPEPTDPTVAATVPPKPSPVISEGSTNDAMPEEVAVEAVVVNPGENDNVVIHPGSSEVNTGFKAVEIGSTEKLSGPASIGDQELAQSEKILAMLPPKFVDPGFDQQKKNVVLIPDASGGFVELDGAVTKVNYRGSKFEIRNTESSSSRLMRSIWRLIVFAMCAALLMLAYYLLT